MTSRRLVRELAGWSLVAAIAAGAGVPHQHSLFAELFEGGRLAADRDNVLTTHNPLSGSIHFHAILRTERDACAACHGVRGLARPVERALLDVVERTEPAFSSHPFPSEVFRQSGSSRGPPLVA